MNEYYRDQVIKIIDRCICLAQEGKTYFISDINLLRHEIYDIVLTYTTYYFSVSHDRSPIIHQIFRIPSEIRESHSPDEMIKFLNKTKLDVINYFDNSTPITYLNELHDVFIRRKLRRVKSARK